MAWKIHRAGMVMVVLAGVCHASAARGQTEAVNVFGKPAVGVGVMYSVGRLMLDAPPNNASNEIKGYVNAMPSTFPVEGPMVGISFGNVGLLFSHHDNTINLDKPADLNQDGQKDITLISAHRVNTSISVVWHPLRAMLITLGRDIGTLEFRQIEADGTHTTRKFGYENPYFGLALLAGVDPSKHQLAPFLSLFAKVPIERGNFSGTSYALAAGLFF